MEPETDLLKTVNIGDVVALKSHPYFRNLTNIKVSGEPLHLSPLMVVTEIFLGKMKAGEEPVFRCKCLWFSSKMQTFEHAWIKLIDLKIVSVKREYIVPNLLSPGELVTLRSMDLELSKLKSSLNFNDTRSSIPNGDTVMSALLSFLSPTLHVIDLKKHNSKLQIHDKNTGEIIRMVPEWDVKCFWYNALKNTFSEVVLPIEAFKFVNEMSFKILNQIDTAVEFDQVFIVQLEEEQILVKPKHLAYRSGYYFLRAFNYITNSNIEINVDSSFSFIIKEDYYVQKAPNFDVRINPKTGVKALRKEIIKCIKFAAKRKHHIRIKYKNRHDELSVRTLWNYDLIKGGASKTSKYLIGFCGLRLEERTFKIDRIQSVEELIL